jgi:hypothetical protein
MQRAVLEAGSHVRAWLNLSGTKCSRSNALITRHIIERACSEPCATILTPSLIRWPFIRSSIVLQNDHHDAD